MPLPTGDLRRLSIRQILDALADEPSENAAQFLAALQSQVGLSVFPTLGATLQIAREEWADHVQAGRAFGKHESGTAPAGQLATFQVWNPIGSGKLGLVAILGYQGSGSVFNVALHNVQLSVESAGQNLRAGGDASKLLAGYSAQASSAGTAFQQVRWPATEYREVPHVGIYLCALPEGWGVHMMDSTAATTVGFTAQWAEIPL